MTGHSHAAEYMSTKPTADELQEDWEKAKAARTVYLAWPEAGAVKRAALAVGRARLCHGVCPAVTCVPHQDRRIQAIG